MTRKIVSLSVVAAGLAACLFLIVVMATEGLSRAGAWAAPLAALAGIAAAVPAVRTLKPSRPTPPLPPEQQVQDWMIDRPDELAAVVKALWADRGKTVGITTGMYGAGGFGKTTLAQMVCADRQVRRRFGGRVYFITVGRDLRDLAALAAKVNDVIKLVTGANATFTDPQLAGQQLGALLDAGPRLLLALDDVWDPEQLAPFTEGGKGCVRLVTTRAPELLAGQGEAIRVDQMTPAQARALLTAGLPQLDTTVADGLLAVTGRWPLLLRLVNRILADYAQIALDVSAQGAVLLEQLSAGGPAVVDALLIDAGRGLDIGQPQQRARAVRATIEASTGLLNRGDKERFAELGVFAEDEAIPFGLVAQLWEATGDLDSLQAAQVCKRLVELGLVSQDGPARGITLHDVIRDFLRADLGKRQLVALNIKLLKAVAAGLPPSDQRDPADHEFQVAWWELGDDSRYLWDHLIEHFLDAERLIDAEAVSCDLRWVGARLERFGPAAPATDLSAVGTQRAVRLQAVLARTAHLLAPTLPRGAVIDVLHSRVATDPDWGPQGTVLREINRRTRLVSRWPMPDLVGAELLRVLPGHGSWVGALAVAPGGSWLVSGGADGRLRIWDMASGRKRAELPGHVGGVNALAVAPNGIWLASGGEDQTVRIWKVATGQEPTVLRGHLAKVNAVAVDPGGKWVVSGGGDGHLRIWDVASGREQAVLRAHIGGVNAVAVGPGGRWLVSGGADGRLRIWDVASGQEQAELPGHPRGVSAVAVGPGGNWLLSGGPDGRVRTWDVETGRERAVLRGHPDGVNAVAVAPDGSWLASGGDDRTVRIWDKASGRERAVRSGHTGRTRAVVVAPDGAWLASGGDDQWLLIWDMANTPEQPEKAGHAGGVNAVAVAPDSSWLASGGADGRVRIWDAASGHERFVLYDQADRLNAVAVAPDGRWLASGGADGRVRIWNAVTGKEQTKWSGHAGGVRALAVGPTSIWLVSGGADGRLQLWDVAGGRQQAVLRGHAGGVTTAAVGPDGTWLVSGGADGRLRIWDVATGRKHAELPGHVGGVQAVAVAPDGTWLASGGHDHKVRIWDTASLKEQAVLHAHGGSVNAVALAPDGSSLASGGLDRTVRIWDMASGQVLTLMRLNDSVNAAAWLNLGSLTIGGPAGLYLFDFLKGAPGDAIPSIN